MKKNSIGIIGGGFIGSILKRYYPDAKVYDIKGDCDPKEEVLRQDIIFIAFNLLDNGISQQSYDQIAQYAKEAPPFRLFIIKSTFVPGITDRLQSEFEQQRFIYNPEFLTESTAWEDFTKPQYQILGCPHQSLDLVHEVFGLLPEAPVKRVISPRDAEMLKHAQNSYYALKVSWFNQLYDACGRIGSDYETVKEILTKNAWIGDSHSVIMHKSYRGFGTPRVSKCLPKDLAALLKIVDFPLLKEAQRYNDELCKQQNLS